jgi:hypothetical protein
MGLHEPSVLQGNGGCGDAQSTQRGYTVGAKL